MPTPGHYRKRLNDLYEHDRFDEALDLSRKAEAEAGDYHDEAIFWQACLLCKLARPEEGLVRLQQLVRSGGWVGAEWLLWDPALEPIREREEFQALLPVVRSRRDEAGRATRALVRHLLPPGRPPDGGFSALMVLHGRGNEGEDALERWAPAALRGYAVFSLQSSQPWSPGLYQWDLEPVALQDVRSGLEAVRRTKDVASRPPILGGFSQGGLLALRAMLGGGADGVRQAILLSPSTRTDHDVGEETLEHVRSSTLRGWSVVTISGEKDFSLSFQRKLHEALLQAGAASTFDVIPGGAHDYPQDLGERLEKALAAVDATSSG